MTPKHTCVICSLQLHCCTLFPYTTLFRTVAGRTIDTDLRWKLVIALSALGGIDEAGIDEFLAADDTQSGRKSALTARAALPTAEAKARAWRLTVEQDRSEEHTSELQSRG